MRIASAVAMLSENGEPMKKVGLGRALFGAIVASIACSLVDWKFRPSLPFSAVCERAIIFATLFFALLYLQAWLRARREAQAKG